MICEARSLVVCRNMVPEAHPSLVCNIRIKGIEALSTYCTCLNTDKSLPVTTLMSNKVQF